MTSVLAQAGAGAAADGVVDAWAQAHRTMVERAQSVLADIKSAGQPDLAMLAVANRQLRQMMAG